MKQVLSILESIPIPKMCRVGYRIEGPQIADPAAEIRSKLSSLSALDAVAEGHRIAVTVGSRGISNQPLVVKTLVEELGRKGAKPFIIPTMGSHAGADAKGQRAMVENLGITEEYAGAPILSSMEVVQIGKTASGLPVYVDKFAYEADGVVLLNRVKAHTSFKGKIESGLLKMSVIGLGKQKGAEVCHELGFERMEQSINEIARVVLSSMPIVFGVALIENGKHETAEIHVIHPKEIEKREPVLLARANELMARVPFKELEAIIIDRIGKDISGTGLDTNVVGRYHTGQGSGGPSVTRISVLDITETSHGNGNGLGIADFTTKRVFDKFDFTETYPNSLTSNVPVSVKMPMVLPSDEAAIRAAIKTCLILDKTRARVVRLKDTISLSEMLVSESLLEEVEANPMLKVIEGPKEMSFDAEGNLF